MRVSPTKGVMRFGKKGKLSPKFIGPYEILERIGKVAYRLALPVELDKVLTTLIMGVLRCGAQKLTKPSICCFKVHDVFHVSQLKKYIHDALHVISPEVRQILVEHF